MLIKDIEVSDHTKEYFFSKGCKTVDDAKALTVLDINDAAKKEGYNLDELLKVVFAGVDVKDLYDKY